jgi:hypothetical protein
MAQPSGMAMHRMIANGVVADGRSWGIRFAGTTVHRIS